MTQYTIYQRQAVAAAYKAAKQYLSHTYHIGSKEQFICHAIRRAQTRGGALAAEVIMKRLAPYGNCVESFLEKTVGPSEMYADQDAIQKYRHRWLDALIKEFSDEEK